MWQHWTNAVLGLAIGVVAFLGLSATAMTWSLVILGAAILVVSLWGAGVTTDSTYAKHA